MRRRQFLKTAAAIPVAWGASQVRPASAENAGAVGGRIRPGQAGWPSPATWEKLKEAVGGRLIALKSPLDACRAAPQSAAAAELFNQLRNPYYIGDDPALTQTSGWLDAWTSAPSAYAVAASGTDDVVAAVNFAREHHLRLVVKGGGHSYQGTSNAPDSLLIWTRPMNGIVLHDAFVPKGCEKIVSPQPAVSVGSGVIWGHVYDAVTTKGGRYVQGGGCTTVGVAGLIQSGGFGSFSKRFGLAAAGLLEAEVVLADGSVQIANACSHPELFWALKGGGGGSFGVVTKLTLRTRTLPEYFGVIFGSIAARSDDAYRELIARIIDFYRERLFNPHWGEQIRFRRKQTVELQMLVQGLDRNSAEAVWRPFLDWVASRPKDFTLLAKPQIAVIPARQFWNPKLYDLVRSNPIAHDDRPHAAPANFFWAANRGEAGQFVHAYRSAWLPARLLEKEQQRVLADALFAASQHWTVEVHFNKGLAGAPAEELATAKETATNPAALDAFALAIIAGESGPAFPEVPGHEPNLAAARRNAAAISDGRTLEGRQSARLVRLGERLLRARLAARVLGRELSAPGRRQKEVRSKQLVFRAPRCRQRRMEFRRLHEKVVNVFPIKGRNLRTGPAEEVPIDSDF
jgi:FAD/FMN-containing dehydrogenase